MEIAENIGGVTMGIVSKARVALCFAVIFVALESLEELPEKQLVDASIKEALHVTDLEGFSRRRL